MPHSKTSLFTRAAHQAAFFRNWLKDPFHVAAIAPTGRTTARLMASGIRPGDRVVELGAGTGTITEVILDAGVRPDDLYLIESNADFVKILRTRFPQVHVLHTGAESILEELHELRGCVDFVISGLPILWFQKEQKTKILTDAFKLMSPRGSFHQFSYWLRPPVSDKLLQGLDLEASRLGFSPLNLPPAFAFRWQRIDAREASRGLAMAPTPLRRLSNPRRKADPQRATG